MSKSTGNYLETDSSRSIQGRSNSSQKKKFVRWTDKEIERLWTLKSYNAHLTWPKFASIYNNSKLPYRGPRALSNKYKRVEGERH